MMVMIMMMMVAFRFLTGTMDDGERLVLGK